MLRAHVGRFVRQSGGCRRLEALAWYRSLRTSFFSSIEIWFSSSARSVIGLWK